MLFLGRVLVVLSPADSAQALLHVLLESLPVFQETRALRVPLQQVNPLLGLPRPPLVEMRFFGTGIHGKDNRFLGSLPGGRGPDRAVALEAVGGAVGPADEVVGVDDQSPAKISLEVGRAGAGELMQLAVVVEGLHPGRQAVPPRRKLDLRALRPWTAQLPLDAAVAGRGAAASVFYALQGEAGLAGQVHVVGSRFLRPASVTCTSPNSWFLRQRFSLCSWRTSSDWSAGRGWAERSVRWVSSSVGSSRAKNLIFQLFYNQNIAALRLSPRQLAPLSGLAGAARWKNYCGLQVINKMSGESTFSKAAKSSLYNTTNQEYGSPWVQSNLRPERVDLKTDLVPTYSEIVGTLGDFKRAERLIKSKVIREALEREGVDPHSENARYQKKTEFHVTKGYSEYPEPGLNVGPSIYRTNNMNYGSSRPADFEIQEKYFPCNSNFTKAFNGGSYKFNGLNTVKTVSQVHTFLNDM